MTSTIPLKRVARIISGQSPPSSDVAGQDGSDRPFLQGNAEFGQLHPAPRLQCASAPKRAETGDILLSVRAPVGALNIADRPYGIGRGLCAIRPSSDLNPAFAWWALVSVVPLLSAAATGSTYKAVTGGDVGQLPIPQWSRSSQRAIADYLDRETARIDKLISTQERMVELLDERLQALVGRLTHAAAAISTGDPVPTGWSRVPLRRCLRSSSYGIGENTKEFGQYAVLGMSNLRAGELVGEPTGFVAEVDEGLLLAPGDLLFNRTNSRELVGKVGIVRSMDRPTTFASYLVRLRPSHLASANYLNYLLNTREVLGLARSMALPSIGQANLNPSRYSAIVLPIPSVAEQERITSRLDEMAHRTRDASRAITRQVELLRERRQALITAAITGQFDIPGAA